MSRVAVRLFPVVNGTLFVQKKLGFMDRVGCRTGVYRSLVLTMSSWASALEVCMGMGKTGIPWVLWDSHGNGSKISHGMGMGMKSLKREGIGTKNLFPHTSSPHIGANGVS